MSVPDPERPTIPARARARALALPALLAVWTAAGAAGCGGERSDPGSGPTLRRVGLDELRAELGAPARPGSSEPARGRLLNVWATWCPPCVAEMPELVEVAREHERRGLAVLALSLDAVTRGGAPEPDAVLAFARRKGIDLEILYYEGDLDALGDALGLPGTIPYTLALDPRGRVLARQSGPADAARLRELAGIALGSR